MFAKCFFLTMHGLIYHFTDLFLTWAIKCPRFVEDFVCWHYAIDLLNWSKSSIELTLLWSVFFDVGVTIDTILDMTKKFPSSVCFCLFPIDVACDNTSFFCLCRVITLAYRFGKMVPVTAIMDAISLWFSACSRSSVCRQQRKASTKRGHLICYIEVNYELK